MDHIGIDVHKRESHISILAEGGTILDQPPGMEPGSQPGGEALGLGADARFPSESVGG